VTADIARGSAHFLLACIAKTEPRLTERPPRLNGIEDVKQQSTAAFREASKRLPKSILLMLGPDFRTAAWGRDLRMTTRKACSVASVT
jgi:hypothetical protein